MSGCEARRESDNMCCHRCGFTWDVSDPDRPECKTNQQLRGVAIDYALGQSMKLLTNTAPRGTGMCKRKSTTKMMLESNADVPFLGNLQIQPRAEFEPDPHYRIYPSMAADVIKQAKLLHPGDIQGLIDVAEMACDFHEHTQSLSQRANFELAKIRELIK